MATDPPDRSATAALIDPIDLSERTALVTGAASGIGAAIARAMAASGARIHAVDRDEREAGLTALLETARELAALSDPAGVLEAIVRRARILLGTDLAYLTLYDPEAGDTFMRTTDGSVSAAFQSVRLSLGDGLGGLVAATHKPYWTANYQDDQRFAHTRAIDSAVAEEGIIAICGTPLLVGSDFVGVLFAANRTPRPFTREEVVLLTNLATLAAVTLVQTRAFAEAETALSALSAAHETVHQYAAGVERAAAAHDRFASLVLDGGGVDDLTHALGELLEGWVVLVDEAGNRRSAYGPAPGEPGQRDRRTAAEMLSEFGLDAGRLVEHDGSYATSITAAREVLGSLLIGGIDELTDSDRRTVERAAVVTALVLLFERYANDTRQAARNRVVSDLADRRGSREDRLALARSNDFDPQSPFCVLVLRGGAASPQRQTLISASTAIGADGLVGAHDGDIVALVPGIDPDALAKALAGRLGHRQRVTVAGVGPISDLSDIPGAHDEGVRTVAALIALGHEGSAGATTQLGFAGLIVGSDPDVSDYVQRVLGPVLDYDERRGSDLRGTLVAYFAAGGSPRHAATALHVHVNTVSQRLERIGTLLGEEWQRPDQALEIQLALRLRRLQRSSL